MLEEKALGNSVLTGQWKENREKVRVPNPWRLREVHLRKGRRIGWAVISGEFGGSRDWGKGLHGLEQGQYREAAATPLTSALEPAPDVRAAVLTCTLPLVYSQVYILLWLSGAPSFDSYQYIPCGVSGRSHVLSCLKILLNSFQTVPSKCSFFNDTGFMIFCRNKKQGLWHPDKSFWLYEK